MSDFWNEEYINKARKDHICEYCNQTISKGNSYYREIGNINNEFNFYKLCERCKLLIEICEEPGEDLGSFSKCMDNSLLITCPKCEYYDIDYSISKNTEYAKCKCDKCNHKWKEDLTLKGLLDGGLV